jgi:hypothetical protein
MYFHRFPVDTKTQQFGSQSDNDTLVCRSIVPSNRRIGTAPMAKSFFAPPSSVGCAALSRLMAHMIHLGANLSTVRPLIAAVVPSGAIMFGVFYYGEPASTVKLSMLISACVLIGIGGGL